MSLTLVDFFCGAGGSSQGAAAVPGVSVRLAANHWQRAIASHAANFPHTEHFKGDLHAEDVSRFPAADLFWASPECTYWSHARGRRRDFDKQPDLFGETLPDEAADRSRALMWDVPRYLDAMQLRGRPVLAGVVENVTDERKWVRWAEWVTAIRNLGYHTRLIALNSMHARPVRTLDAPQSRDRLYLTYWLSRLGRDPDWDKWLRPAAWCPVCETEVRAVQVWKKPGTDMGCYRRQYLYLCPNARCRNEVVEPAALPAAAAIDWSDLGTPVGDRTRPMKSSTRARIAAGLARYARPLIVPAAGTRRRDASPTDRPLPTRTTTENDGIAVPPFLVPLRSGRPRTIACTEPLATVVASGSGHGLAVPPFLVIDRGGAADLRTAPVTTPLATLTSGGNPFGLAVPDPAHLLVPYYSKGAAQPDTEPVGTLSTRDRYGLATGTADIAVDDVLFRMLAPREIGRAMAFADDYAVLGNQREKVRQYGNAVTPPVAEILIRGLVEAVTGHDQAGR